MSTKSFLIILWLFIALHFSIKTINAQTGVRSQIQTQDSTNSNVANNPSNNTNFNVTSTPSNNVSSSPSNNTGTSVRSLQPISDPIKPEPPSTLVISTKGKENSTSSITETGTVGIPVTIDSQKGTLGQKVDTQPVDPELEQTYKDAMNDYYSATRQKNQAASKTFEFNNWVLENRKATFDWQHFTGKIIFWMVLFLVLTGVAFSGIQFYIAMKQANRRRRVSKSEGQEIEILPTTLKANLSGVEVSSSIFGVIILVVSFLFFYLYLVYVYPITVIAG